MNIFTNPKFKNTAFFKKNILKLKTHIFLGVVFILSSLILPAQDIHYSQFYNAPFNINPALTGIFRGDVRFMGNYRSQWNSVPVDYMTFTAAADLKFIRRTAKKGFTSAGLIFNYDRAGISKLTLVNIGLSGSHTTQFSNKFFGTFGLMLSANQRNFKLDDLRFDNQFDNGRGQFNGDLPINEDFLNTSNFYFDLSAGINFRWQTYNRASLVDRLDKRSKIDFGVGVFHLTTPNQSFFKDFDAPLSIRISPYALGTLQVSKNIDLVANIIGQFQNPYKEILGMLGGKLHLNRKLGKQFAIQLGVGYRFQDIGDSVMPSIEVFYNGWRAGFSYDINISDFNIATNRRGGPEFTISYIIRRVRPLPAFKICPLI